MNAGSQWDCWFNFGGIWRFVCSEVVRTERPRGVGFALKPPFAAVNSCAPLCVTSMPTVSSLLVNETELLSDSL